MLLTPSLIDTLTATYPQFRFVAAEIARWNYQTNTVYYSKNSYETLHEVGHALLDHRTYRRDVELVAMEAAAWECARSMAPQFGIQIDDDSIQDALDTYRDWLHARSACPNCTSTGLQVKNTLYRCVSCDITWRVNQAKMCGLRRYKTHPI